MPWRGPSYEGEFPSLGWGVEEWARVHFRVPDGPLAGEPLELTDEQLELLVRWYALDERGRFVWRRAAVRRAQGWGKSPLLAVIALAELAGPTRFGGWDAVGEPVGMRPAAPWVQIAAVSEDQTANTYAAAHTMAGESDLAGTVLDVGLTRTFLKDGPGRLEPVTASAGTRLGQRITACVLDESHLWTRRNGGVRLAATIRRNAAKMGGRTFESTNAHQPGEGSVAEATWRAAQQAAPGLLYDSREGPPVDDLHDHAAVVAALRVAYGDSARWVDLDRIAADIRDPSTDPDDARRYYLNQLVTYSDRPVDVLAWEELADRDRVLVDGERVGLGFDGSMAWDATALYGCTVDGFVFEVACWERPANAGKDWSVPRLEVHRAVRDAFHRFDVGQMLCDVHLWASEIDAWAAEFGEERVLKFDTRQTARFAEACDRFATAVRSRTVRHDGQPGLTAHLAACRRRRVRPGGDPDDARSRWVFDKADTRQIDRAVAAALAVQAAWTAPATAAPAAPFVFVS